MYEGVIKEAVKLSEINGKLGRNMDLALNPSLSNISQGGLPYLIPQKTNVLTGASTQYYRKQVTQWNNEYLRLVNY